MSLSYTHKTTGLLSFYYVPYLPVKGIVHRKWTSSSCPKHILISFFSGTQGKIFWGMCITKQLLVPNDFHRITNIKILWKSMGTRNGLVTHILQNIFPCVPEKKEIHICLGQFDYVHLRWTIPLKNPEFFSYFCTSWTRSSNHPQSIHL